MTTQRALQIAVLGARRRLILHDRTEQTLQLAAGAIGVERGRPVHLLPRWLAYDELQWDVERALRGCDAVLAPACDAAGWEDVALEAIQVARVLRMPLLATGGGFELSVREVLENVLGEQEKRILAATGTLRSGVVRGRGGPAPGRGTPSVDEIVPVPGTRLMDAYASPRVREVFCEEAGLAPPLVRRLEPLGLRPAARRADGLVCALELVGRMFHVLVAYVPQLTATGGRPHPAFRGLLEAALAQGAPSPPSANQLWAWPQ